MHGLVLVILDRNLDLFPMVSHSWTYQALVNDVLGMKLNRVSVEVSNLSPILCHSILFHLLLVHSSSQISDDPSLVDYKAPEGGRLQKKVYDLDAKDFFWAKNAANPFPHVAEEIDLELNKCVLVRFLNSFVFRRALLIASSNRYKTDASEITRSTGVGDINDLSQMYAPLIPSVVLIAHHTLRLLICFLCHCQQRSFFECCESQSCDHSSARVDCSQANARHSYEHCYSATARYQDQGIGHAVSNGGEHDETGSLTHSPS